MAARRRRLFVGAIEVVMQLRWYQQEAVDAAFRYWQRGGGNPLIVLPTGSGKTAVSTEVIRRVADGSDMSVLFVAHRKELIKQTAQTLLRVAPRLNAGIFAASLGRREIRQVTLGQTQSVYRQRWDDRRIELLIIDEAHLTPPEGDGQYQRLIRSLTAGNPDLRVLGLTATPYRLGQGCLTWGDNHIFDSIVYSADIKKLIAEGYLVPLVPGAVSAKLDTSNVAINSGEFVTSQLDAVACDPATVTKVAEDVSHWLSMGRTSALLFGVSVDHARMMRNEMKMRGHSCEVVTGETDARERERIIERFKRRELQAIASCDVLTTGFDAPVVDILAVARPTMSPSLWVQMAGRGMRTAEGKTDCVVLDYGENTERHGPIDQIKPKPRAASKGDAAKPVKVCAACQAEVALSALVCPECDAAFPAPERKVASTASNKAIISDGSAPAAKPETITITGCKYGLHISMKSGTPTLRVDYLPENGAAISEWVCLEHEEDSFAWRKAAGWWVKAGGDRPAPNNIEDALARIDELGEPFEIVAKREGKYWRVESAKRKPRAIVGEPPPTLVAEPPKEYTDWWEEATETPF